MHFAAHAEVPVSVSTAVVAKEEKLDWFTSLPFLGVHLMCLFVFYTGAKPVDLAVCFGLYVLSMWGITAGFHRYFSHRAYKTNREIGRAHV